MRISKFFSLLALLVLLPFAMNAQEIRYVSKSGQYANDGKSWANAKNNIQDAINDLVDNGLTGEVWVAAGRYTPTESTEQSGGSTLYMAFKIPAGITVRGGFPENPTAADVASNRPRTASNAFGDTNVGLFTNKTILSGRLASTPELFEWNSAAQKFNTKFYGNTYHVVWFAMEGFDSEGRANPLKGEAVLEGCIVEGGNASNSDLSGRKHNAYGGGIYMVDGAVVRDCEIRKCNASRDGGGVYMDGGGLLQHSYVHTCQSPGISTDNGYGGGVCLEGNKTRTCMTVVVQSVISNNLARFGGGLAMKVNNSALRTNLAASSVLVNNNTATTSSGGVFLNGGGNSRTYHCS